MSHKWYFVTAIALLASSISACSDAKDPAAVSNTSGGEDAGVDSATPAVKQAFATTPSHGSTIALAPDDSRLVVANGEASSATVFSVDFAASAQPTLTKMAELPVGAEPSQVVVNPSGEFALVISRKDQKLVRIDGLQDKPVKGAELSIGSEATGLALTPGGKTAWLASSVDGTVVGIDTATMKITTTIDLNAVLAESGYLGDGLTARPSLSHPRSVAITNNGDKIEDDETLWVTEYDAVQKTPVLPDGSNADTAKVALIYKIPLATKKVSIVEIPAMADMGFHDHKDAVAGCFPNQLLSMNIQGGFGYVTSVCASPKGPQGMFTGPANAACTTDATCPGAAVGSCAALKCATNCTDNAQCGANRGKCVANVCAGNPANVKSGSAPAVSIIDLGAGKTIATVNLAKEFDASFTAAGMADDATRRLPLVTFDVGFVPGTVTAYFPSNGTDAVFRVDFNATYDASTIDGVGSPKAPFINLTPAGVDPSRIGRMPTGIAIANKAHTKDSPQRFAFVINENTRNVAVLDLEKQEIAGASDGVPNVVAASALPTDPGEQDRLEGKRLFGTGLGRWSFKGQGWVACQSCHIDGLSDNVTWYFPRGPRQPQSLDGTFNSKDPTDMRISNWNAFQDEISDHEMGAVRSTAGGIGAIVKDGALSADSRIAIDKINQAGLAGSSTTASDPMNPGALATACVNDDWQKVLAYIKSIRSPRRPSNLDVALVAKGADEFASANCQGCHGGDKWTVSARFYTPDSTNVLNVALQTTPWGAEVTTAGFPAALLPATTPTAQNMRYKGSAAADFDSLTCALRNVGTFGVAEAKVGVAEVRKDMVTAAQGNETDGKGYNPPSLLGANMGAPYLHAGQARTLEALLSTTFAAHYQALAPTFLADGDTDRAAKTAALVQYLLSIDEDAKTVAIPALGPTGGSFCHTL